MAVHTRTRVPAAALALGALLATLTAGPASALVREEVMEPVGGPSAAFCTISGPSSPTSQGATISDCD